MCVAFEFLLSPKMTNSALRAFACVQQGKDIRSLEISNLLFEAFPTVHLPNSRPQSLFSAITFFISITPSKTLFYRSVLAHLLHEFTSVTAYTPSLCRDVNFWYFRYFSSAAKSHRRVSAFSGLICPTVCAFIIKILSTEKADIVNRRYEFLRNGQLVVRSRQGTVQCMIQACLYSRGA